MPATTAPRLRQMRATVPFEWFEVELGGGAIGTVWRCLCREGNKWSAEHFASGKGKHRKFATIDEARDWVAEQW